MKNFLIVMAGVLLVSLCSQNKELAKFALPLTEAQPVENTGLNTYPNDVNPGGGTLPTAVSPSGAPTAKDMAGISHPVAGYLDDGTPFFAKWVTGTIGPGSILTSISHGLNLAYTNLRIIQITPWIVISGSSSTVSSSTSPQIPQSSYFDDINIYITRSNSTGGYTVKALILYK